MERKSRNRSAKSFARKMDKGLTKHFKEVFNREPQEGDKIEVNDAPFGWSMTMGDIVFVFVAPDGTLHTPDDMGFEGVCTYKDGKYEDRDRR